MMSFAKLNYNCVMKKRFILKRLCLKEKTSFMGLWGLSVVSANHAADKIPIPLAPPLGWSVKKNSRNCRNSSDGKGDSVYV